MGPPAFRIGTEFVCSVVYVFEMRVLIHLVIRVPPEPWRVKATSPLELLITPVKKTHPSRNPHRNRSRQMIVMETHVLVRPKTVLKKQPPSLIRKSTNCGMPPYRNSGKQNTLMIPFTTKFVQRLLKRVIVHGADLEKTSLQKVSLTTPLSVLVTISVRLMTIFPGALLWWWSRRRTS